ncbi:MAG: GntR family transcriptional regulator [Rhodospirillaceae bacterium]|nr:GntR family transcriptional regulator [Rhodospirillaceae bacterium]
MLDDGSVANGGLIRDGVYDNIRADILACELAPGSRIHENDLAARYDVSKSPVRDALLRLQVEDLIEVLPRKGYRVRPISINDVGELYEMRLLLEKACVRRAIDEASDAALAGLDSFRTTDHAGDLAAWVRYNRQFHRAIADAAGNDRLAKAAAEVIDQFDRLTFVGVAQGATSEKLVAEHGALIDAIQDRGKGRAQRLITDHIKQSQKRVFAVLNNPAIVD